MHDYARVLLIINGIYDLACACSILVFPVPVLSSLHTGMFTETSPVTRRLLAYWILTYGSSRLAVGMTSGSCLVAALTYFAEAFCFAHEHFVGRTLILSRVRFPFLNGARHLLHDPFIIANMAL